MRTLLERLKPANRDRLNLSFKDFPATCEKIEKALHYNHSMIGLTIDECCCLLSMTTNELLSFENIDTLFEEN
jgi:hypothetical protein